MSSPSDHSAPRVKAVLFDVGGVLTQPLGPLMVDAALASGLDLTGLREVIGPMFTSGGDSDEPAHRMERGELSLPDFFDELGDHAIAARALFDPSSAHYVFAALTHHPGMAAFVSEVQAAGIKTAVVSNVIVEWLPSWEHVLAAARLDFPEVLMSCNVGLRKPNAAMYQLALDRVGVIAAEALFIDDFPPMAEGARQVGMQAVTLTDHETAIAAARSIIGL